MNCQSAELFNVRVAQVMNSFTELMGLARHQRRDYSGMINE